MSSGKKCILDPRALRMTFYQLIDLVEHLRFQILRTVRLRNSKGALSVQFRIAQLDGGQQLRTVAGLRIALRNAEVGALTVAPGKFWQERGEFRARIVPAFGIKKCLGAGHLRLHGSGRELIAQGSLESRNLLSGSLGF